MESETNIMKIILYGIFLAEVPTYKIHKAGIYNRTQCCSYYAMHFDT